MAPINPAPPVTKTESRVIMGDMIDIICALCGKNQQVKILYPTTFNGKEISNSTYSARRLPDRIHYRILKCERCSLVFSSPIFPAKKLVEFYRESLCNYEDQIPYLIKTYFEIIKKLKKDLPKNPKVLEVGCGNGFFLKALTDSGFTKNVFGVEPSSKMALEADSSLRSKIKVNFFKSNLYVENSFDLVLCFHTLDHLFDPREFIKGAYSLLKKNGYIVIVVHDTQGLSVKIFGEKSAIFDIEHIYLFNKKTLRKIFELNRFKVIDVFNVVNKYPLNYWVKMSGFPLVIRKIVNYTVSLIGIDKIAIPIPAGNIGIIAKKT